MSFPIQVKTKRIVWSGDTYVLVSGQIEIKVDEVNTPLDLTPWGQWKAQWRPTKDSEEFFDLDVIVNPEEGRIAVVSSPEVTSGMGCSGVWDVQATDGFGNVRTWFWGKTKWDLDVTRDG